METIIIGQGYNIEEDSSVGKELVKLFESSIYDSFTCLVAFASYGGVTALTPFVKEGKANGMNIKVKKNFMPYIKRKGIRDLYLIKIARVGTRKEGQPDNDPNDFRLVFEIEFVKELFNDYKPIELEIWHTFTDTNMRTIVEDNNK